MAKTDTNKKTNNNKKKKSSKKSGPNSISMKLKSQQQQQHKPNPFETIWSRRKFDIIGKKRKGEERRVGQARIRAIDKRKKTLLKEYEQSGKASVFVDKRIGEENDALGEFDKAILRSQRERQMKIKKDSKYNLSDGEEDEFEDYGVGRDDFDEEVEHGSDDDDDAMGQDRSTILKQLNALDAQQSRNADLSDGEENRPKSKKEIMEEVIQKSKFFKAQKAKEKEESEKMVEQLDKEFESLVQSQAFSSLTQANKMNALKSLVNPNFSKELKKQATLVSETSRQEEPDSYDKLVNEMTMEMRARPSDRTKSVEEIAEEEKERLERLEQERQNRMLTTDDASDDDDNTEDSDQSTKISSHISGDDLGDSFTIDEKPQKKKGWVDEILEKEDAEDSENEDSESCDDSEDDEGETEEDDEGETEEDEDDEKLETLKDWEQSDDDVDLHSEEDDETDEEGKHDETQLKLEGKKKEKALNSEKVSKKKAISDSEKAIGGVKQPSSVKQDLPFKIDAPTNIDELNKLFEGRSNEDIIEAIRRVRVCNAISLAAENRKKTQVFYGLLLQYFATLANQKPLNFQRLNFLVKPLMEMSAEIPYFSAICARERLLRTRTKFCEDIKDPEKSCWPSLKTLFLLRLWSMIFPCSDFRHAVMTPAILLMCEHLMRCPVQSTRDAAVGTFLCSMILLVTKQSQKFCPEALTFLKGLLFAAVDKDSKSCQDSQKDDHLLELKAPLQLLCIRAHVKEIEPLDFIKTMDLPEESSFFDTDGFRASILLSVVETVRGFVNIWTNLKAFPEIFLPLLELLTKVSYQQNMPDLLQEKLSDVVDLIRKKVEEHHKLRQPLQMRKQKPVPIKLLNPKFEENFVKGRDYDPDRERAEFKKLKKMHRNEAKGAARELRKDNYFLHEVKEKEKQRVEQERRENYGKVRAFLQEQEHAFKSGQLGKNRKRSR